MTPAQTILVTDDNGIHQYSLARHLEHGGYSVLRAITGKQTLDLAASRPDAILLDINLPDISGLEVCGMLKENHSTRDIPVIIYSGTSYPGSAGLTAKQLGAVSFLIYPIDMDHLLSVLKGILAGNRR